MKRLSEEQIAIDALSITTFPFSLPVDRPALEGAASGVAQLQCWN